MKIEVLQVFVAAAEQNSFSKAGELMYLSQSTVSRYIREFESQLGSKLFVRNAHMCELTTLGKQVFVYARRIVNEWENIERAGSKYQENESDAVKIGYTYQDMLRFITLALSDHALSSKKLELSVRFGDGSDIIRLIQEEQLNCAVMHLPSVSKPDGLNIWQIKKCRVCVVMPETHRLAGYEKIELAQLVNETDVRITNEVGFYRMIDEAFLSLNLPQIKHEYVRNAADCMPIIYHRNHICFSTDIYQEWPGCKAIPIQDFTMDFSLVFVTKAGNVSENIERMYKALCASLV